MISELEEVTIVGTVHSSIYSRPRVKQTITEENPDVVAIELDRERLSTLLTHSQESYSETFSKIFDSETQTLGTTLRLIRRLHALVSKNKVEQGHADMLPAVEAANTTDGDVALIDITTEKLTEEVVNTASDGLPGFFESNIVELIQSLEQVEEYAERIKSQNTIEYFENLTEPELREFRETLRVLLSDVVDPLITDRDSRMAGQLQWLRKNEFQTVAIVGKLHLPGIRTLLEKPRQIPEEYVREPDWMEVKLN